METLDLTEFPNPYRKTSFKVYLFWTGISTIANHAIANTITCIFIRTYLAMIVALILLFNKDKSIIHRLMIYLVYLEINPRIRIIENLNYSVMIVRLGMLSMSLEQIILNPNMEIAHAIILVHLIIVAAYLPNYIDTQEAIAKTISYFIQ
jgi:hypothetical protein